MAKSVDFFRQFVDDLKDDFTNVAADGKSSAEIKFYVDTGSYILNAAISGSIFRGIPDNKAILLAGDPATGKTFFARGIIKYYLMKHPDARVFYYDTESALTNEMLTDVGIDLTRVAKSEPDTLENFRNKAVKLLDAYAKLDPKHRFPMIIVLDSLSQLPSNKEVADIADEKDTRDMTKPGVIKGMFRVIRLKAAKLGVPIIVTNHVYESVGAYVPTKIVAGGKGAQYAADTIIMLSKKAERQGDSIIGNVIHVHMKKSRLSRENTKVDTRILFDGGLDRYYGLLEYAEKGGVIKKVGNKWEFPDGIKAFEKQIYANPEKFFTQPVLEQIDEYIQQVFKYSAATIAEELDADLEEGEDE